MYKLSTADTQSTESFKKSLIICCFQICYYYVLSWLSPPLPFGLSTYMGNEVSYADQFENSFQNLLQLIRNNNSHNILTESTKDAKIINQTIGQSIGKSNGQSIGKSNGQSIGKSNGQSIGKSIDQSFSSKKHETKSKKGLTKSNKNDGSDDGSDDESDDEPHTNACYDTIKEKITNELKEKYGSDIDIEFEYENEGETKTEMESSYSLKIKSVGRGEPNPTDFKESEIYVNAKNKKYYIRSGNGFVTHPLRKRSVIRCEKKNN